MIFKNKRQQEKLKRELKELTNRRNGVANEQRVQSWVRYFRLTNMNTLLEQANEWLRNSILAIYLKQWKKVKTRFETLKKLGRKEETA